MLSCPEDDARSPLFPFLYLAVASCVYAALCALPAETSILIHVATVQSKHRLQKIAIR